MSKKDLQDYLEMVEDLDRQSKEVMMDIRNQIETSVNELEALK
jgi:hypothetical protein